MGSPTVQVRVNKRTDIVLKSEAISEVHVLNLSAASISQDLSAAVLVRELPKYFVELHHS